MTLFSGRVARLATLAGLCLIASLSTPLRAQSRSEAALITVPDVYPADEGTGFVLRKAGEKDLVVLNIERLDVPSLYAALAVLRRVRKGPGVAPGEAQVTMVQGFAPWQGRTPRAQPAIEQALRRLLDQPRVRIGNLGSGRWIELSPDPR